MFGLKEGDYWALAGGAVVGAGVIWALQQQQAKSSIAYSYAYAGLSSLTCSQLCSQGLCDAYNCSGKCSAGCDKCGGAAAVGKNCPTCGTLCSQKRCTDYNCRCTAGCDACGGAAAVGNCGGSTGGGTTPPPSGGGTGGTNTRWFFANGSTAQMTNVRCNKTKCGVDTGSGSGGNRWETVKSGWMDSGFEVVLYVTIKSGAMCGGGDEGHIGLKHGGPEHKNCSSGDKIKCGSCSSSCSGSGCCCWWDSGLRENGKVYLEREYPHACNANTKYYGNIGRVIDNGKPLGLRWLIKKEGSGVRLMFWADTSGVVNNYKWTKMYDVLDTGQIMPSSYLSKIRNSQNVEIRMSDVNCNDIKVHNAETRKMTGSSSSYAIAYPAVVDEMRPLYEPRISMS